MALELAPGLPRMPEMVTGSRPEEVVRSILTHKDAVQMGMGVNPSWHHILASCINDLS